MKISTKSEREEFSKEYSVYKAIKQRCFNKKCPTYFRYGGRGITMCDKWVISFSQFIKDMGRKPDGYQIERINNDLGYHSENCKWATPKENMLNRSSSSKKSDLPRGVLRSGKNYSARIMINKKSYHIANFTTKEEASSEYIKVYHEWYGKNPPYVKKTKNINDNKEF